MPDPPAGPAADRPPGPSAEQPVSRGRWRRHARPELWRFLELFALCGFVVVQPLLSVIGGSLDFFIFHGVNGGQVVALVAVFVLVPPVALWAVGVVSGLAGRRVRQAVHLLALAGLFGLFMIELGKQVTAVRGALLVLLAAVVTAVILVGYVQLSAARQMLRFAAVGPLVFVLLFAFASPASAVVLAGDRPSHAGVPEVTGPHPPIVMIVFDEFPLVSLLDEEGHVDADRFPNFARLASDSTWYRNATAAAGWSPYAVPAMLSGMWPAEKVAAHYAEYPNNLFTLLGDTYQVRATESISRLCPPWHCGALASQSHGGLPVALAESSSLLQEIVSPWDSNEDPTTGYREPTTVGQLQAARASAGRGPEFLFDQARNENRPARFVQFLERLASADAVKSKPTLNFLHMLIPHQPWTYLPSGTRYNGRSFPMDGDLGWSQLARQRHLAQVEYADRLLGQVLSALTAAGVYRDTLVVVTADHGISFTPGSAGRNLDASERGAAEMAWVPLFIKGSQQESAVIDDRNWQHVDLLPTLAHLAGVEVPWPTDGISAARERRSNAEKVFYEDVDDRRQLDASVFLRITNAPLTLPPLPSVPMKELVGTQVSAYLTTTGPSGAEVANASAFAAVDPASGTLPALLWGTLPDEVPPGAPIAIALNGSIGAVVRAIAGKDNERMFAALIADEHLFVSGKNRVDLFLIAVSGNGTTLQQINRR